MTDKEKLWEIMYIYQQWNNGHIEKSQDALLKIKEVLDDE